MHTILRLPTVRARTGLSRSTIYQRINEGTFPAPINIGERAVGWLDEDIARWIADRIREHEETTALRSSRR